VRQALRACLESQIHRGAAGCRATGPVAVPGPAARPTGLSKHALTQRESARGLQKQLPARPVQGHLEFPEEHVSYNPGPFVICQEPSARTVTQKRLDVRGRMIFQKPRHSWATLSLDHRPGIQGATARRLR